MENMTLRQVFEDRADKPFVFIQQGGNQGDSMIYAGARKLADQTGLNYREIQMGRKAKTPYIEEKEIIYVNGGGGFCTWWNWTPRLLKALAERFPWNLIIVGPSTVALQEWYLFKHLPRRGNNLIFFAREWTTQEFMKERFYPGCQIDHDTALHLEPGDGYLDPILKNEERVMAAPALLLREDPESLDNIPPEIEEKIKAGYFMVQCDPCQTDLWARCHTTATEIWTNRSHSAILGSLLGKKTYMFDGSYHKNRSIWEYSLKDRGVEWVGE